MNSEFDMNTFYIMMGVISAVIFVCMMTGFSVGKRFGYRFARVSPILAILCIPALVVVSEMSVMWAMFLPPLTPIALIGVALVSFCLSFSLFTGKPKQD